MRRTLISDLSELPRSSDAPSDPVPASGVEAGPSDFGRWLTHDLRPKGAPLQIPIVERASEPPSVVIDAPEEPELASWLLRDLKPRSSAPPPLSEQPDSLLPLSAGSADAEAQYGESTLLPPDSLVPHAVSEAPLALSAPPLEAALDAEDLAVLPSRSSKPEERRKRRALLLLAALLGSVVLAVWFRSGKQQLAATGGVDPLANAALLAAAPLPPPPPPVQEEDADDATPATAPHAARHGHAAEPEPVLDEESWRARGRRAGDAVARFADLPPPTLSKLAREERQKARAHEASVRARKAANKSEP